MMFGGEAEVWNVETKPMTKRNCERRLEEIKQEQSDLFDGLRCVYIAPEKDKDLVTKST